MSLATLLSQDVYRHQYGLKHINTINNDGFSALFVVNTPVFDNSGVAHAVEHMVFRASMAFPQPESLFQLTALTDVKINASTFANNTYYHCQSQCPKTFILAINYLLNGLLNPVFHAKYLSCEIHDGEAKGVIYRELLGAEQEQSQKTNNQAEYCYGGVSISIGKLSLNDLTSFHQKFYHPRNITLVTANANIEQISKLISALPMQKNQVAVDINTYNKKPQDGNNDSNQQKKYPQEINKLITVYQQWLQDPYHQEIDDYIDVESSNKPQVTYTNTLQTFSDCSLIAPLTSLSNNLNKTPFNEKASNARVKQATSKKSLPSLFTKLYQEAKSLLNQPMSSERMAYASDKDNALWLAQIEVAEQKLANIASFIISAHPIFLAPRCQGQCYAIQALTIDNSSYLAIYSAFDITPESRLKKISSYLLTLSQDISFINECLPLAKIKYCRAKLVEINQVNDIAPIHISAYLQKLANRSSF